MKFKITHIYGWEEDVHAEMGDCGHMSDGDIMRLKLEEYEKKVEQCEWPGLPFVCEAESEDEAIDKYNEANCELDYYKATEAEFEDRHDFDSVKLRQLLGLAEDNTLFRIDKGNKQTDLCVFNSDFSDNYETVCEQVDPLLDREVISFCVGVSEDPTNEPGEKRTMPTMWVRIEPEKDPK